MLKCPHDKIFDFHFFFTFSCIIRFLPSCQISIHHEHQNYFFTLFSRECTATINQCLNKEATVDDDPTGIQLFQLTLSD